MIKNDLHFLQPAQGLRKIIKGLAGLIFLLLPILAGAQPMIKLEPSSERKALYNNYFRSYALGKMDKGQVATLLQSRDHFDTLIIVAHDMTYAFSLEAKDVRADEYVLRVLDGSTSEVMPRSPNKTYSGKTLGAGLPVCITADEHFFCAMITTPEGPLFIESAKLTDTDAGEDLFVIYHEKNVIRPSDNSLCGVTDMPSADKPHADTTGSRSRMTCKQVQTGIVNDKLMFQKYGSVGSVEVQNLAVINLVNALYDDEFTHKIRHVVWEIYVVTGTDPWYSGTDAEELLTSFSDWSNGIMVFSHVVSLWTNRVLDSGVIGLAWVDELCMDQPFNILRDFSSSMALLRVLQAHELGHNYGYGHDMDPNYIMSPSASETTTWSSVSVSTLNTKFDQNGMCLSPCQTTLAGGRVGIGTTTPHNTAALEIYSINKGLLMPRLTPIQRNAIPDPADGLTVYDTHTKSFWFYNGSQWVELIDGTDFQKQATHVSFGQAGNIGVGLTEAPANKLDIAIAPRLNLGTGAHPSNLPVYITGGSSLFKGLEVRNSYADAGVGLEAGSGIGGIYSIGWVPNVPLTLSTKGTGDLRFNTNGTERARITGNGSLAIGTTTPHASAIVDISSTSKGILIPRMSTAERTAIAAPSPGLLVFDNTTNTFWYRGGTDWLELTTHLDQEVYRNGPDKIYMGLTDSVGIGTTTPSFKLDVRTAINQYGFAHTAGGVELTSWIGDGGEIGTRSNHNLRLFAGDGYDQFTLLPTGNIGIGFQNPANRFDIAHSSTRTGTHATGRPLYVTGNPDDASNGPEFRHFDGTQGIGIGRNTLYAAGSWADQNIGLQAKGQGSVLLFTNGQERFRFSPAGNLGIGVIPNAPLQFSNATVNRKVVLYEVGNNDHQFFGFGVNIEGTLRYQVPVTVNDHVFYAGTSTTTSSELMRIRGNGNVTVSGLVEVENYIAPTLLNSFTNYGSGHANAGYYKDKMGRVHLRGLVNNVNNPTGLVVFTLPAGYRPTTSGKLVFTTLCNNAVGRVDILTNGDIQVILGTAGWISLDGISFRAD